jgi:hypothetical protein
MPSETMRWVDKVDKITVEITVGEVRRGEESRDGVGGWRRRVGEMQVQVQVQNKSKSGAAGVDVALKLT